MSDKFNNAEKEQLLQSVCMIRLCEDEVKVNTAYWTVLDRLSDVLHSILSRRGECMSE